MFMQGETPTDPKQPQARYKNGILWVNSAAMRQVLQKTGHEGMAAGMYMPRLQWKSPWLANDPVAKELSNVPDGPLTIIRMDPGDSLSRVKTRVRHEMFHATEEWGGKERARQLLTNPLAQRAIDFLGDAGYDKNNSPVMFSEIGAHLASGPDGWALMGLDRNEARQLFEHYAELLSDANLARMQRFTPQLARELNAERAIRRFETKLDTGGDGQNGQAGTGEEGGQVRRSIQRDVPAEEKRQRGLTPEKKGERGSVSIPNVKDVLREIGSSAASVRQSIGARTDAVNALKSTLEDVSDKDTGERIRTLAVGERDARIAETNQVREALGELLPDHVDREALTLYRDFKNRPGELLQFLNGTHPMYDELSPEERSAALEKIQKLEPVIESALNPSPEMLGADDALTHYFTEHLREGRELGFLDSKIPNEEYITHLLQPSMQQPSKIEQLLRGKFGPKRFKFSKQRFYPTMLHAVVGGARVRTLDALDALGVYGEKYATTAAYHLLVDTLRDTEVGKWGSYKQQQAGNIPANWVELSPESRIFRNEIPFLTPEGEAAIAHQSLFVPPEVEQAMRPILDPNYMTRVPGFQQGRAYQAYIKAVELGLSFFHVKALGLSALNNMGPGGVLQTTLADMKSPEFLDAEKAWTRAGLTTPILDRTAEVYIHMRPNSLPTTAEKIRALPILKQLDNAAAAISHFTFGIVQRKNKVVDASLKFAGWIANNPNATPEEMFKAQRQIAKEINAVYGGLNWEIMGHNRVTRELSKALLLAPDWTFSNVANLKYATEGGVGGNAARFFWLRAAVFGLALTAGLSMLISGKLSKDPTRVMLGKDKEGKELTDNVFFVGAPGDVSSLVHNVVKYGVPVGVARTIAAKLGPIARAAEHMMSNQDATGRPIIPKKTTSDLFGNKLPGRAHEPTFVEKNLLGAKELAKETFPVPFSIGTIVSMLTDKKNHYTAGQYASALINGRKPLPE